jgi:hypothetical protein
MSAAPSPRIHFRIGFVPRGGMAIGMDVLDFPAITHVSADREGDLDVFIQPSVAFPGLAEEIDKLLRDDGIERDCQRLAVMCFECQPESGLRAHELEGHHLWCEQALRLGWRVWNVPFQRLDPAQEVILAEDGLHFRGGAQLGHGLSPNLVVMRTDRSTPWVSASVAASPFVAAAVAAFNSFHPEVRQ